MGRKLDAIIGRAFRAAKCLTLLKLVQSRVRVMKNKRTQSAKQMRREIANYLQSGQEVQAYNLKVDTLIKEENLVAAYELIDQFCHAIIMRIHVIETQKTCPLDMKEPITSLIYAAPRCPDLRELSEIREMFIAKYGKEFADAAAELRPDCGVNKLIIEKLTTRPATGEMKDKVMKDIARENMINWTPASAKTSTTSGGVPESSTPAFQSGGSEPAGSSKPQEIGRSQPAGPSKPQESAMTGTEALSLFSSRIQSRTSAASNSVQRMESHDEAEWHDVPDKFDEDAKGEANNYISGDQDANGKNSSSAGIVHSTSLHLHEERSHREKVAEEGTETMLGSNVSFPPPFRKAPSRDSGEEYIHAGNDVKPGQSSASDLKKPLVVSPSPSMHARKEYLANAAHAAFQSAAKATEAAQAAIDMALRFPDEETTSKMSGNDAKNEDSIPLEEAKGDSQDSHSEFLEKGDSKVEQQPTYSENSDDEDNSAGYKWTSQLSAGSDQHKSSLKSSHVESESPFSLPNDNSGGSGIDNEDPLFLQHKDSGMETAASHHVAPSFETDEESKPKFDDEGDAFEDSLSAEINARFDDDYKDVTEKYKLPNRGPLRNRHRPFFYEEEENPAPDKVMLAGKLLEDEVFDEEPQVQLGRFPRSAVPKGSSTSIAESHFVEESEAEYLYPTSSSAKDIQEKGKSASASKISKFDDEEVLDKKPWMQSGRFSKHIAPQQSSISFVKPHFDEESEEDQVYPVRSAKKMQEVKNASVSEADETSTARASKLDDEDVLDKKPWMQSGRFSKHIAPQWSSSSFVKPHFDEESEEDQVYPVRSAKKMLEEVKNASLSEDDETSTARASSKYNLGANREKHQAATQPQEKPLRWISKASRTEEDHELADEQMPEEDEPSTAYGLPVSRRARRNSAFNADKKQPKQWQLGVEQENEEDGTLVSKLKLKAASPFENDQLISTSMLKPANIDLNDVNEDDSEPDDKPLPARYKKNIVGRIERPNRAAAAPRKKFYEEDLEQVDQHPASHSRMAAQLQGGLSQHTTRFSSGSNPTRKQTLYRDEEDPEEQTYSRTRLTSRLGAQRYDHGLGVEDKLSSILSTHPEKHQKEEEDGDEEEYLQLHPHAQRQDHRLRVDDKLSFILATHAEKYQKEQEDDEDEEEYLHLRSRMNHKVSARYTAKKHPKQEDDEEKKRLTNRIGFVSKQMVYGENSEDEQEGERLPSSMGFVKKPMTHEQDLQEEEEKEFLQPFPTHKVGARYTAKKQPKQEPEGTNKHLSSRTELDVEDEEGESPQSFSSYRMGAQHDDYGPGISKRPSLMAKPVSQPSNEEENLKWEEERKDKRLPIWGNRTNVQNLRLSTTAAPARKQMLDDRVEMVKQEYLSKEESDEDEHHQPLPKSKEAKKYSFPPLEEDRYEHPSSVVGKSKYSQLVSREDQLPSRSEEVKQDTSWRPRPSVGGLKDEGGAGEKSSLPPEEEGYQRPSRRRYSRPSASLMEEVEDQKYHHSTPSTYEKQQRPLQGKTDEVMEDRFTKEWRRPSLSSAAKTGKKWNEGVEEEATSTHRSEMGHGRLSSPMEDDEQQQPSLNEKYQEKYLFSSQGLAPSSAANSDAAEIDQRRSRRPHIESHQDVSLGMGSKKVVDYTRRPLYNVGNVTSSSTPQTPFNYEQQDVSYNLPARKVEEMKFTSPTDVSDNVSKMEERPGHPPRPTTDTVPTLKTTLQQQEESHQLPASKVEKVKATPPTRLSSSLATSSIVNSTLDPTAVGVGSTSKASSSSSSGLGRLHTANSAPAVESASASVNSDKPWRSHKVSGMEERPSRPPRTVDTVSKPKIPLQQQEEGHRLPASKVEEAKATPPTMLSAFSPSLSMSSSPATSSITTSTSDPTVLGVGSSSASSSALGKLPTAISAPPVESSSAFDTSDKSRLSHVHPKLPDVDDVFAALRQARRRRAEGGDGNDQL